ncbi:MAG: response regulator [Pseudomonadota bacterium]
MAKVLLMEDQADQAALLADLLQTADHDVTICYNGSTALRNLKNGEFDIVVADILVRDRNRDVPDGGLSLMGGIRTMEMGRRAPWDGHLPVIAISGGYTIDTGPDALKMAETIGADECLPKPLDTAMLLDAIARLTEQFTVKRSVTVGSGLPAGAA